MGQDLDSIVTKVSDKEPNFKLREEQVVVLLSWTHYAKKFILLGIQTKHVKHWYVYSKKSAYTDYMGYMVENISGAEQQQQEQNALEINFTFSTLRSANAELPFDDLGYAYILFSVRQRQTTYIGQTKNLSKRLQQHNRGTGAKQTQPEYLRPWSLLAYVAGFNQNRQEHISFETEWQKRRDALVQLRNGVLPSVDKIADIAKSIIKDRKSHHMRKGIHLRYFKVTTFEPMGHLGQIEID